MLRQIIVIISCLAGLYLNPVLAETAPVAEAAHQSGAIAQKRGALFKIAHAGNTLYLFGTIHVGKPEYYPLEPIVTQALKQSSKIALEIDPLNTEGMQPLIAQYGLFPAGASLQLEPALQARLEVALKKQGVPYSVVAPLKPWLVTMMLALNEYTSRGYQAALGVDAYLAGAARTSKKTLVELENPTYQMSLFGKLALADQIRLLDETLADIEGERGEQKINQLINAWSAADIAGLDTLAKDMAAEKTFSGKFLREAMLDGRNPGLASGLEKLLKSEKQSFASIGALHLVGKDSEPALLRQRGYQVERLY